jgi:hypothetical protein
VTSLEELPGRVDALSTQISHVRDEMRTEFSAVRGEVRDEFASVRGEMRAEFEAIRGEFEAIRGGPRTPDMPSLLSLHEEIRGLGDMLRDEIRETAERGMSQTRALRGARVSNRTAEGRLEPAAERGVTRSMTRADITAPVLAALSAAAAAHTIGR